MNIVIVYVYCDSQTCSETIARLTHMLYTFVTNQIASQSLIPQRGSFSLI